MSRCEHSLTSERKLLRDRLWPLLAALVVVVSGLAMTVPAASAVDPQPDRCDPSSQQSRAGEGMQGWIDDQPVGGDGSTLYEQYGWSGLQWSTCQLDHKGPGWDPEEMLPDMAKNPGAWIDTNAGNLFMGGASTIGAIMTQIDQWVSSPGQIMRPVDDALTGISTTIQASTWGVFAGLLAVVMACFVVIWAAQGDIRRAIRTVVAILMATLAVAAVGANYTTHPSPANGYTTTTQPGAVYLGQMFDGVATGVIGSVSASAGCPSPSSNIANGCTLYDQILVPIWAEGATGYRCTIDQIRSGGPGAYDRLCYDLYRANATSYAAWAANETYTPVTDYKAIVMAINGAENGDRAYFAGSGRNISEARGLVIYDNMRGLVGGRAGLGFKALFTMLLLAIIRIPCSLLMLMGLLVIRLVVMFIPIWALMAIAEITRPTAKSAGKMVMASVYNATVFGIIGVAFTIATANLIASPGGFTVMKLLMIGLLTIVVWIVSAPFRSVTVPATGDALSNVGQSARSTMFGLPARVIGGVAAIKSYQHLRNISREEDRQTDVMTRDPNAIPGSPGPSNTSPGTTTTYEAGSTHAVEPPRLEMRTRNPIRELHMPIRVRSPLDLSEVDQATGEVRAKIQSPIQFHRPIEWQTPVFLHQERPAAPPPPAPPTLTMPGREVDDPAQRIIMAERMRQREAARNWMPPTVASTPERV